MLETSNKIVQVSFEIKTHRDQNFNQLTLKNYKFYMLYIY